jgi:hypothetical protein
MMLKAFPEFGSKFRRTMFLVSMSILNIALPYLLLQQIVIMQELIRRPLLPL